VDTRGEEVRRGSSRASMVEAGVGYQSKKASYEFILYLRRCWYAILSK